VIARFTTQLQPVLVVWYKRSCIQSELKAVVSQSRWSAAPTSSSTN